MPILARLTLVEGAIHDIKLMSGGRNACSTAAHQKLTATPATSLQVIKAWDRDWR
jgi:hypothetical protein